MSISSDSDKMAPPRRDSKLVSVRRHKSVRKSSRHANSLRDNFVETLESGSKSDAELSPVEEIPTEELFDRIQEQKEIIANVRSRPWSMAKKLKVLRVARKFVEKHEGKLSKKSGYEEVSREAWRKLKRISNNTCAVLTLWDNQIKTIESYFGSSVASYFIFLRWLVQINVIIGIVAIAFLVVPEMLVGNKRASYKQLPEIEKETAWDLSTIWSLGGYIKHSVLFYGYYTNDRVVGEGYRLPLAYFLVGIATFAYSFVALLRKMAKNSRLTGMASSDDQFTFSWQVFSSWDYMIGNSETAENKSAAIATAIREAIVEEQEKEKDQNSRQKLRVFLRVIANVLVLLLLAGSLYSIQFSVSRAQALENVERETTFWEQNEVSIVVTIVTMITPSLFEVIASMENYHPRTALRIQLARILMLYLGNLYTLMIGLLGHVTDATAKSSAQLLGQQITAYGLNGSVSSTIRFQYNVSNNQIIQDIHAFNLSLDNAKLIPLNQTFPIVRNTSHGKEECWETNIGQELMKLSIIDFLSTVITILLVDFIRALFVRYFNICCCWDLENKFPEYGEFKIAENVLHLVYNQGITWIGSFFCPLLPIINVLKLTLIMYIRSWAVTTCNVPHQRVFRASRSNNFYLAVLLFMLFLSLLPTVWVIVRHQPSNCGPFSKREWMYTVISETLEKDVPSWLRGGLQYLTTPVVILPVILLMSMLIYYLQAIARSTGEANARLKLQLQYERKEGKKNIFKLGAGNMQESQENDDVKQLGTLQSANRDFNFTLTPIQERKLSVLSLSQEAGNDKKAHEQSEAYESSSLSTPEEMQPTKYAVSRNKQYRNRSETLRKICNHTSLKGGEVANSTDEAQFSSGSKNISKSPTSKLGPPRYLEVKADITADSSRRHRPFSASRRIRQIISPTKADVATKRKVLCHMSSTSVESDNRLKESRRTQSRTNSPRPECSRASQRKSRKTKHFRYVQPIRYVLQPSLPSCDRYHPRRYMIVDGTLSEHDSLTGVPSVLCEDEQYRERPVLRRCQKIRNPLSSDNQEPSELGSPTILETGLTSSTYYNQHMIVEEEDEDMDDEVVFVTYQSDQLPNVENNQAIFLVDETERIRREKFFSEPHKSKDAQKRYVNISDTDTLLSRRSSFASSRVRQGISTSNTECSSTSREVVPPRIFEQSSTNVDSDDDEANQLGG